MKNRDSLDAELAALNASFTAALEARRNWMDEHMIDYASYKVGEELFDLKTGQRLGVVSKLYRPTWGVDNPLYQGNMDIGYQYETAPNYFDNTSRQPYLSYGNRDELVRSNEAKLAYAKVSGMSWAELFSSEEPK